MDWEIRGVHQIQPTETEKGTSTETAHSTATAKVIGRHQIHCERHNSQSGFAIGENKLGTRLAADGTRRNFSHDRSTSLRRFAGNDHQMRRIFRSWLDIPQFRWNHRQGKPCEPLWLRWTSCLTRLLLQIKQLKLNLSNVLLLELSNCQSRSLHAALRSSRRPLKLLAEMGKSAWSLCNVAQGV